MMPSLPPEATLKPPLMDWETSLALDQAEQLIHNPNAIGTVSPAQVKPQTLQSVDWLTEADRVSLIKGLADGMSNVAPAEDRGNLQFSMDASLLSPIAVEQASVHAAPSHGSIDSAVSTTITTVEVQVSSIELTEAEQPEFRSTLGQQIQLELRTKPGEAFREAALRQDLQQLYHLGLFSKASTIVTETPEGQQIRYELVENSSHQFSFSGGTDQFIGPFGSVSYRNQVIGTLGQRVDLTLQVGTTGDVQFRSSFFSPYRTSQPEHWGYGISLFRDRVQAGRIGGGVTVYRPLGDWQTSLGLNYARMTIQDRNGQNQPLSFSGTDQDDLVTIFVKMVLDQRNNPFHPTQGWMLSLGTEQSLPIGLGNVLSNHLQATFIQYIPLGKTVADEFAATLVFRAEAATILGDLRPYRSWRVNDPNFIQLEQVRTYLLASTEYRFPIGTVSIFNSSIPVGGVLFLDAASDLGSRDLTLGQSTHNTGSGGIGYGVGLRARSPLGLLRVDVGLTSRGALKIQAGVNQRF